MIQHKQLAMLAMYFVDQFIFYQINCLLIDIFDLKLSLANFDYRLRIPVPYSEYKGKRIQDKYDYLCLTPNALLRIALCSTRDALPGVVYDEAGQTYTGYRIQARKCSYSEQGLQLYRAIRSETQLYGVPNSEHRHYPKPGFVFTPLGTKANMYEKSC